MRNVLIFLSIAVFLLGSASLPFAEEQKVGDGPEEIIITKETCLQLIDHVPDMDVNFQPGVDVRGNIVAPANLAESPQVFVPDQFIVDLDVFLGDALDIDLGLAGDKTEASIVDVTFNTKTKEVLLNGQVLLSADDTRLSALCQEYYGSLIGN